MTVTPSFEFRALSSEERQIVDVFRRFGLFRIDYDAAILDEALAALRQTMDERQADRVMSDAFLVDNELRFRRPEGIVLREPGDLFATADEEALVALIGAAEEGSAFIASIAAEKLGIDSHDVLRQACSLLRRSLGRGGIEIGCTMPSGPRGSLSHDLPAEAAWH